MLFAQTGRQIPDRRWKRYKLAAGHVGAHAPERSNAAALELVGLAGNDDAFARQLSAGQRKRATLARLWQSPAPLWLMDEPYANLDLQGIELVNALVQGHLDAGGASLVTTHGAYAAPPVRTRELRLGATT